MTKKFGTSQVSVVHFQVGGKVDYRLFFSEITQIIRSKKSKGSQYSIAERRVPDLIPVLGSQPVGDVSHKPGGRLPLLKRAATISLLDEQRYNGCKQFA